MGLAIVINCLDALDMENTPCISDEIGYPVKFVVQHINGNLVVAGVNPTVAEFQSGIAAVGVDKLIILEQVTNGDRKIKDTEEESGADSADGLRNVFGCNIETTAKIKSFNEDMRSKLATLSLHNRIKVWTITSNGWVLGGKKGYRTANWIAPLVMEGFGKRATHDISFIHKHNLSETDPATKDSGYLNLAN